MCGDRRSSVGAQSMEPRYLESLPAGGRGARTHMHHVCEDGRVGPTCVRQVSSHAHVTRRRMFSPDLSSGSVFALPRPMCLHDDARPCPTCLRDVSSHAHTSSRQRVPLPELSSAMVFLRSALARTARSGSVFGRPAVFAVFAWHVSDDSCVPSQTMR